jgi:hypothetical protein
LFLKLFGAEPVHLVFGFEQFPAKSQLSGFSLVRRRNISAFAIWNRLGKAFL